MRDKISVLSIFYRHTTSLTSPEEIMPLWCNNKQSGGKKVLTTYYPWEEPSWSWRIYYCSLSCLVDTICASLPAFSRWHLQPLQSALGHFLTFTFLTKAIPKANGTNPSLQRSPIRFMCWRTTSYKAMSCDCALCVPTTQCHVKKEFR